MGLYNQIGKGFIEIKPEPIGHFFVLHSRTEQHRKIRRHIVATALLKFLHEIRRPD